MGKTRYICPTCKGRGKRYMRPCPDCTAVGMPPRIRVSTDCMFGIESGRVKADCPKPKKFGLVGGLW
jgi:DnaJ-class molecular chaperone